MARKKAGRPPMKAITKVRATPPKEQLSLDFEGDWPAHSVAIWLPGLSFRTG
jgi:hypothetical protein